MLIDRTCTRNKTGSGGAACS